MDDPLSTASPGMRPSALALVAIALLLLAPSAAGELIAGGNSKEVVVDGQRYEFTAYQGTFSEFDSAFTASTLPWWGSASVAQQYATEVYGAPFLADGLSESDAHYVYFQSSPSLVAAYYDPDEQSAVVKSYVTSAELVFVNARAVPEIDGEALAQGLLAIAALGLSVSVRRREAARSDAPVA
ncbi:hypothetical protein V6X63_03355 [Spiribacter sp. 221]|uniref:hypothetical protein n=1 Tax=Spiribacter onubensis TaxID=3122420 RepID=UPI00349FCE2B